MTLLRTLILLLPTMFTQVTAADAPATRPGGVLRLDLGAATSAPVVRFAGARALVDRHDGRWQALIGIPLETAPGELTADVTTSAGARHSIPFTVVEHAYPIQHLRVKNRRHVDPTPADLERYARERAAQENAKRSWREVELVSTALRLPVDGRRSSAFGLRRTFNGEPRAPHSGIDIAVPLGTPVASPGGGVVTLTGDYFFNGQTVFVDHGQGLITMLCHLSRTDVREGQRLRAGERVGLAGASGRATGPHVHWSVFLNGTAVDPDELLGPR